jgi:prepilin-type N-terminal cleavage/methylation domain-containing protein
MHPSKDAAIHPGGGRGPAGLRRARLRPSLAAVWRGSAGSGHTLPELLVVLTILTLFALIVMPRMASALLRTRMDAAEDSIRSDLRFAHARAVATGLRHQFALDTTTGEVVVMPFHPEDQVAGATGSAQMQPAQAAPALKDVLPTGVRVTQWTVSPLGYTQNAQPAGGNIGATPLVFYPEGTADSGVLILEDGEGRRRGITIDGFSGEIRSMTEEELKQ